MIASEELMQLRQRVITSFHLGPLSLDETRRYIERITFIGPPAVYSHREVFAVRVPVATGIFCVEGVRVAWIVNCSTEFVSQNYVMEDNAKIILM